MKNFIQFYKDLDPSLKNTNIFIFLTYFFGILSYPFVRSATGAIFYEAYTSDQYSLATFIGVIVLIVMIFINNKLQGRLGIHKVFLFTGLLSTASLAGAYIGYDLGIKQMAYVLFATKETYIVLLIHSTLAFANALYDIDTFKRLIGPIGAIGSLGGIIGGQVTSILAKGYGTQSVFLVSLVFILCTTVCFYFTKGARVRGLEPNKSITPLQAVRGVKKYVLLIGIVVALSQFVIFIADLQFNMVFEKMVTGKDERTAYLGKFYSYINLVSLFLQFVVLPFILMRVSSKRIFLAVPILYAILVLGGLSLGVASLFVIGGVFVVMKGTDYSVFSAVKDVMYHPLLSLQKFGAKYITDMFVYRFSKATIAFIFAQFVNIQMNILSSLQFVFLSLWIVAVILLFKEQKKLNH